MPRSVITVRRRTIYNEYTKSWSFNGSTAKITSAAALDFSFGLKFCFDFWFKHNATGGAAELLTNNSTAVANPVNTFKILRGNTSTALSLQWNDAGGSQVWTTAALPIRHWQHVLVVIDATAGAKVCKVFINGSSSGSLGTNTATGGTVFTSDTLSIDKQSGGTGNGAINCNIKDLRMVSFTGAWDDSVAGQIYSDGYPSGFTLLHRWIGEDTGTTADDSVGASDLTLNAGVAYSAGDAPSMARTAATARTIATARTEVA